MSNDKLNRRAFELALDGLSSNKLRKALFAEFDTFHRDDILAAVHYALNGGSQPLHPLARGGVMAETPEEIRKVLNYCKRGARKAKVMLSVNYEKPPQDYSVADAMVDMMHLCEANGWDFEAQLDRAIGHFQAERRGGQHG